jgi:hypothetical protein
MASFSLRRRKHNFFARMCETELSMTRRPEADGLSVPAGKEFEATTDGLKNTDVHLFVYDSSGAEVAKDDSPRTEVFG